MKRLLAYLFIVLGLGLTFNVNAELTSFTPLNDNKLFINSPELSGLEKIKNIKNKKGKPNKDGVIYIGQKGLILQTGYGIMEFSGGGLFVGYFYKSTL